MKKGKGASIPPGFSEVAVGGSFGVTHDFKHAPVLMGKVVGMDSTMQTRMQKNKKGKLVEAKVKVRIMRVEISKGVVHNVWESYALKGLFDKAKKGKTVWIAFDGQKKIGKNKLNLYRSAIK